MLTNNFSTLIKKYIKMIVYKDLISNDEMITGAYKQNTVYDKEGIAVKGLFEVQSSTKIYTNFILGY